MKFSSIALNKRDVGKSNFNNPNKRLSRERNRDDVEKKKETEHVAQSTVFHAERVSVFSVDQAPRETVDLGRRENSIEKGKARQKLVGIGGGTAEKKSTAANSRSQYRLDLHIVLPHDGGGGGGQFYARGSRNKSERASERAIVSLAAYHEWN